MINETLRKMLILDEGYESSLYADSVGKLTIGIGHNITDKGLRPDEIRLIYDNDVQEVKDELQPHKWATDHDNIRQLVIIDMAFNLGMFKLMQFKKMIAALKNKDYTLAADEMMDSRWASQVGVRADRLHYMMLTGDIHPDYED